MTAARIASSNLEYLDPVALANSWAALPGL